MFLILIHTVDRQYEALPHYYPWKKNVIGVDEVDQILESYEYYDIDLETIDQAIFRLSLVDNDVE